MLTTCFKRIHMCSILNGKGAIRSAHNSSMGNEVIRVQEAVAAGVITFELNRPERRNAISFTIIQRLYDLIKHFRFDPEVRAIILTSAIPGMFCAGADLKERLSLSDADYRRWSWSTRELFNQLERLPMPVLAALDGFALGGGLEMALACDIRIAANDIRLGFPETGLAIIPGTGGTQRLPRLVGTSVAKELILSSRILDGQHAHKLGLVNHVVQQNDSGDAAYRKCLDMACEIAKHQPDVLRTAKLAINNQIDVNMATKPT